MIIPISHIKEQEVVSSHSNGAVASVLVMHLRCPEYAVSYTRQGSRLTRFMANWIDEPTALHPPHLLIARVPSEDKHPKADDPTEGKECLLVVDCLTAALWNTCTWVRCPAPRSIMADSIGLTSSYEKAPSIPSALSSGELK